MFRNVDDKLHSTASQQIVAFGFSLYLPDELVVAAVLKRRKQSATFWAVIGHEDGRRQMFRIRIDRVAKENQLEQRNADHHRERQPIPAHLDEFLCQHRAESRDRKYAQFFHDEELSFDLSMRWMKTSSSPDST